MNRGMHDNTDLINEFDFRVFRVFKFLDSAFNLKRASIGLLSHFSLPMLALFRLKTRTCSSSFEFELENGIFKFFMIKQGEQEKQVVLWGYLTRESQRAQRLFNVVIVAISNSQLVIGIGIGNIFTLATFSIFHSTTSTTYYN